MDRGVMEFILQKAINNESFPEKFFPVKTDDLFIGIADGGNHYTDIGVKEGTILFFDRSKAYKPGTPSMFINLSTGAMAMLRRRKKGFSYAGSLVATLSQTEGV